MCGCCRSASRESHSYFQSLHHELSTSLSQESYISYFKKFHSLSILHLDTISVEATAVKRPQPNMLNEKEFRREMDKWINAAKCVAAAIHSIDFLGWQGEHYVVVRHDPNILPSIPHTHPHTHTHAHSHSHHPPSHTHSSHTSSSGQGPGSRRSQAFPDAYIELKELPPRRRLDTGFGVDLGGPDGCWLERIDVPIDYELVGGNDA